MATTRGAARAAAARGALWSWVAAVAALTGCIGSPGEAGQAPGEAGILGVNGRLVEDGERYWLPLGHAWPRPLYEPVREAMAVTNGGPGPVVVEAVWVRQGGGATEEEFRLVEPGGERALGATDRRLRPGEQLDFDVRFTPAASGLRSAELVVRTRDAGDRVIELAGLGDGAQRLVAARPLADSRRVAITGAVGDLAIVRAGSGWAGLATLGDGGVAAWGVGASGGAWARRVALSEPGPACVAASDSGVWLVGAGLRVTAFSAGGLLRWGRRFGPGGQRPAACSVAGGRLVVASVEGGVVDLVELDAARGEGGGRARLEGEEAVTRALVAASPAGGALVAFEGTSGPPVLALARGGGLAWTLPLAGRAPESLRDLVAADDGGAVVLLGQIPGEAEVCRVVRVRASGAAVWEARLELHGARLALDPTRVVVVGERGGGLVAVGLERGSGRVADVRMLLGPGKREEGARAAALGPGGLALAVGVGRDLGPRHWYSGEVGATLRALDESAGAPGAASYTAVPPPLALGPGADVLAVDGLVSLARPLDATLGAVGALVLETLPWP